MLTRESLPEIVVESLVAETIFGGCQCFDEYRCGRCRTLAAVVETPGWAPLVERALVAGVETRVESGDNDGRLAIYRRDLARWFAPISIPAPAPETVGAAR